MNGPFSRRGFLRGLTTLPLIGGSVSLLGAPTAAAEPISRNLLLAYSEWLRVERNRVHEELFALCERPDLVEFSAMPMTLEPGNRFYVPPRPEMHLPGAASTRAAIVLSAVGADWRGGGR